MPACHIITGRGSHISNTENDPDASTLLSFFTQFPILDIAPGQFDETNFALGSFTFVNIRIAKNVSAIDEGGSCVEVRVLYAEMNIVRRYFDWNLPIGIFGVVIIVVTVSIAVFEKKQF